MGDKRNGKLYQTPSVNDLKCCGNCNKRICVDTDNHVIERCDVENKESWEICDKWAWDLIIENNR